MNYELHYLNKNHTACQNHKKIFVTKPPKLSFPEWGKRVIEKTKCILEEFVFGETAGVCVWVGRIARVEACSYPPKLKSFTFQHCSPITQTHHSACPHSLVYRSHLCITKILDIHIFTKFAKQLFKTAQYNCCVSK